MKINNIELQTQTMCNDIMTFPVWQNKADLVSEYGCLLTAKINCFNLFQNGKKYMTLSQLNSQLNLLNGYLYLFYMHQFDGDMDKTKKACLGKESFSIPKVLNDILGIKKEIRDYDGIIDINKPNEFYYIRTKYKNTGHYSMVVKSDLSYFDSYDGKIKPPENILNVYKIIF